MIERVIRWMSPAQLSSATRDDYVSLQSSRLLISYMLIIASAELFFLVLDMLGGKVISTTINAIFWVVAVALLFFYRQTGSYLATVVLIVVSAQTLLGVQHVFAPDGLVANLFWPPLLVMMSVHLLGTKAGLRLGFASSALVVVAAVLRPQLEARGDYFSAKEIVVFHIVSLVLTLVVGAVIASRLANEVDAVVHRLVEQKRSSVELYESSSALLATVGHDINNYLTDLYFKLDALALHLPAAQLPQAEAMRERLGMVARVVEQTKGITALRTGKIAVRPVPVALDASLQEALRFFHRQIEDRQLVVDTHFAAATSPTMVLAEPYSLVTSVLNNVLSNAIKFSPEHGRIVITLDEEGTAVRLRVADEGIGIPASLLPHVFDLSTPTTRRGTRGERGTGLGLPILKVFMERYGARVELTSATRDESSGAAPGTIVSLLFQRADADAMGAHASAREARRKRSEES